MKGFLTVLLMAIIQAASCRNGYHRYYLLDNEEKNIFYPKILLCEQGKNLDDRRKHQESCKISGLSRARFYQLIKKHDIEIPD